MYLILDTVDTEAFMTISHSGIRATISNCITTKWTTYAMVFDVIASLIKIAHAIALKNVVFQGPSLTFV